MNIYKVTNTINKKVYVGKDTHDDEDYLGSGTLIKRAVKKYGKHNFRKEILARCETIDELNTQEIDCIAHLDCIHPKGYNILFGSMGGDTITNNPRQEEIKNRMSEAGRKKVGSKNGFYGKHHTPETISKIVSKDRYSAHDKENCMCAACMASRGLMRGQDNPMFGKQHAPHSIEKMKANRPDYSGANNPNYKDGRRVKSN